MNNVDVGDVDKTRDNTGMITEISQTVPLEVFASSAPKQCQNS